MLRCALPLYILGAVPAVSALLPCQGQLNDESAFVQRALTKTAVGFPNFTEHPEWQSWKPNTSFGLAPRNWTSHEDLAALPLPVAAFVKEFEWQGWNEGWHIQNVTPQEAMRRFILVQAKRVKEMKGAIPKELKEALPKRQAVSIPLSQATNQPAAKSFHLGLQQSAKRTFREALRLAQKAAAGQVVAGPAATAGPQAAAPEASAQPAPAVP